MGQLKKLSGFIESAKNGNPVYISSIRSAFDNMPSNEKSLVQCILTSFSGRLRYFEINLPRVELNDADNWNFVSRYLYAEVYNILSVLGGKKISFYFDTSQKWIMRIMKSMVEVFGLKEQRERRSGYGRCINVIERMYSVLSSSGEDFRFGMEFFNLNEFSEVFLQTEEEQRYEVKDVFKRCISKLNDKVILGIDVGGTDIKLALSVNGKLDCCKDYGWFPSSFTYSRQLVEPIVLLVRLMRAKANLTLHNSKVPQYINLDIIRALERDADDRFIESVCDKVENYFGRILVPFDAIGLSFPDVVVHDKIVGGETYKIRGIREARGLDFERDFLEITNLNIKLGEFCTEQGNVKVINDGTMAAFTAAMEILASGEEDKIRNGMLAHTIGTEFGTGWVRGDGSIPDIPLEVYNCIIDLGSFPETAFGPDDVRSVNNFNTGIAGTVQKYVSQSAVFRLAVKYFMKERLDLFEELLERGFLVIRDNNKDSQYTVSNDPDMRRPFLEHMIMLVKRENDETNKKIWREIGKALGIVWFETERLLNSKVKTRMLFGGLVRQKRCFDLMLEGVKEIAPFNIFEVADLSLAATPLMRQLKANSAYSIAQFAQAVGAIYWANQWLIGKHD